MNERTARWFELANREIELSAVWAETFDEFSRTTKTERRAFLGFELNAIERERADIRYELNYKAA